MMAPISLSFTVSFRWVRSHYCAHRRMQDFCNALLCLILRVRCIPGHIMLLAHMRSAPKVMHTCKPKMDRSAKCQLPSSIALAQTCSSGT
ncbi:hypothetical protein GDO86_003288 [Hymenochirus boettgeri]|uniref:Uncharacterized protein n=1 Tax=Hymenochirus boettgeri TaxID=247094 RepID=A0A8T2K8V1_9PIPI|nr:hypothetical protein GDO86_003288 [Hymenochirus boettgeri]